MAGERSSVCQQIQTFEIAGAQPLTNILKRTGLQCLAVSPGHQNHNIGTRLLSNGLRLAFQHGWRIAAVCAGERNLRFYTRRGFAWLAKKTSHGVDLYGVVDAENE